MIDTTGCVNNTIATRSGEYFDFADPQESQVNIEDIAIGLSNTCRFAGQCEFYSVAEHSVHCATIVLRESGNTKAALHALLHDAAEAYIGDMPKPLKNMLPEFRAVEQKVESVIRRKFGLTDEFDDIVKSIDLRMLKTEKTQLFQEDGTIWHGFNDLEVVDIDIMRWPPSDVIDVFMAMFELLRGDDECDS
jgi:hypothetical protein